MNVIMKFLAVVLLSSVLQIAAFCQQSHPYRTRNSVPLPLSSLVSGTNRLLALWATKETTDTKETKPLRVKKVASYSSTPHSDVADQCSTATSSSSSVQNMSSNTSNSDNNSNSNVSGSSSSISSSSSRSSISSNSSDQISSSSNSSKRRKPVAERAWRVVRARPRNADNDIVFTVYGDPVPLSRHMVARGHMYNPSAKLQKEFSEACAEQLPSVPLSGPLEATLVFYFKRPKNHYGSGRNAHILKPAVAEAGLWHSKRKGTVRDITHGVDDG